MTCSQACVLFTPHHAERRWKVGRSTGSFCVHAWGTCEELEDWVSAVTCDPGKPRQPPAPAPSRRDRRGHLPGFPRRTCGFCPNLQQQVLGSLALSPLTPAAPGVSSLCPCVSLGQRALSPWQTPQGQRQMGTVSIQPRTSSLHHKEEVSLY